jgi:hypothetical protein
VITEANDLVDSFAQTTSGDGFGRGLTKREYFAAMAMQGIISEGSSKDAEIISSAAVICAAALIKALNEGD